MNAGPSGFQNAPVTKVVAIICGIASVLIGLQGGAKTCSLSYQAIFKKFCFWRILTSIFVFSSAPQIAFGLYLIYYFRVFERQIGSNKYTVFLLFSTALATIFQLVIIRTIEDSFPGGLAPGPYGLIFGSFVPFFFDIPISTHFHMFGAHFSDKSFVYLAGLQLLLSAWKRSFLPGVCGLLAGIVYRMNVFGIRRVKFPEGLAAMVSHIFSPFVSRSSPVTRANARGTANVQFIGGLQGQLASTAPVAASPPPEESVAMLVSMGFDRDRALQALAQARNDVTMATNFLLEAQS